MMWYEFSSHEAGGLFLKLPLTLGLGLGLGLEPECIDIDNIFDYINMSC